MKPNVYILEDDPDIALIMARALNEHGFATRHFRQRRDLEREIKRLRPNVCLIDLTLPDGDGLEVVAHILRVHGIPAIIVTARYSLSDRVIGLELGADDYISKPFEPRELVARVRAVLRRGNPGGKTSSAGRIAMFEGWSVDFEACTLRDPEGGIQDLSAAEARLLRNFLTAAGRVLSRAQLLDLDNPDRLEPEDRSMDARISRLRRKLRDDPRSPRIIRTVYGAGYVFAPQPDWT